MLLLHKAESREHSVVISFSLESETSMLTSFAAHQSVYVGIINLLKFFFFSRCWEERLSRGRMFKRFSPPKYIFNFMLWNSNIFKPTFFSSFNYKSFWVKKKKKKEKVLSKKKLHNVPSYFQRYSKIELLWV